MTHDYHESTVEWTKPRLDQINACEPFGLSVAGLQPPVWQMCLADHFRMSVLMTSVAANVFSGAAVASDSACTRKPRQGRTTVMLRNLPGNYTRTMLLDLVNEAGFFGRCNFLYLPMDFRKHAALGYAFVNLISTEDAQQLLKFFDGFSKWALPSGKVCKASWSSPHQGLEVLVARYRNSPLMHRTVPDEYRPILFARGVRIPFPAPTKTIKPPRQGTERVLV